jgi:hypothetical protein
MRTIEFASAVSVRQIANALIERLWMSDSACYRHLMSSDHLSDMATSRPIHAKLQFAVPICFGLPVTSDLHIMCKWLFFGRSVNLANSLFGRYKIVFFCNSPRLR